MKELTSLRFLKLFLITLFLQVVTFPSSVTKLGAQTQPIGSQTIRNTSIAQVTFDPPQDGKPDDTAEGASRDGGCTQELVAEGGCVVPLVPVTNTRLTVAEHPTFFVYLPPTSAKEIFFALQKDNKDTVYQAKIPITTTSGILSLKVPDSAPPLEIDKNYRWTFIIINKSGLKPDSPGVEGKIRRVKPTAELVGQLENKTFLQQAALYGKNGIWYDMLASLAVAMKAEPGNATIVSAWQELLSSAGLKMLATKSLLN